ncbi:conserved hypothetical protein [Pseudomonas sp. 8AS]|uniref:hypothetical protein n=1 Tax=Pseudomonas sp. 8AS TaxID=2653163 RepID=UPI0012F42D6F|nr:hypothetical protein [Pseudomonas sp. 8AS]VXB71287.1 conserved hypothetical protein [Pseudomonas sp. 8AS]
MMSLWSLLTPRRAMRRYALLDAAGVCRALREAHSAPSQPGWIEVEEICPSWLGRTLPSHAIAQPRQPVSQPHSALAA